MNNRCDVSKGVQENGDIFVAEKYSSDVDWPVDCLKKCFINFVLTSFHSIVEKIPLNDKHKYHKRYCLQQ